MLIKYPRVHAYDKRVYISFYINKKKYRLYNGKRIGSNTDPNSFPESERLKVGNLLAAEVYKFIMEGGKLAEYRSNKIILGNISDKEIIQRAYAIKLSENLSKKNKDINIFSGKQKAYSEDYFKGLWTKFKKVSNTVRKNQTLYSFRHSGAIEIFKRTGSLPKLQRALGHSSLQVSLTYLRGLEVAELKEEDMPMV